MLPVLRLCVILLVWTISVAGGRAQVLPIAGEVVQLRGSPILLRGAIELAITLGTVIHSGDELRTNDASRVKIQFADGTVVTIGPDSRMAIASYAVGAGGTRTEGILSDVLGAVRAVVTPGGTFEIRTTTAVASVRGTDWIVEATPKATSVLVLAGAVAVTGLGPDAAGEVLVEAGAPLRAADPVPAPAPPPAGADAAASEAPVMGAAPPLTRSLLLPVPVGTDVYTGRAPEAPEAWDAGRIAELLDLTSMP